MSRHDEIQAEREQIRADLKAIEIGKADVLRQIGAAVSERQDRLRALDLEASNLTDDELAGDYVVVHGNLATVDQHGARVMLGVGTRVHLDPADARLALEQHIIERAPTQPAPAPAEEPIEPAIEIDVQEEAYAPPVPVEPAPVTVDVAVVEQLPVEVQPETQPELPELPEGTPLTAEEQAHADELAAHPHEPAETPATPEG